METLGRDTLLFRGETFQPYVVAHEHEDGTGEWSHGSYLTPLQKPPKRFAPKQPDAHKEERAGIGKRGNRRIMQEATLIA